MEFQHLGRVIHTPAGKAHLGDVYEAILLDAYVHESSEGGDIGHNSREFHSEFQILYGMHIGCELKLAGLLPRVPSRFHQFLEYVVDGGQSEILLHEILRPDFRAKFCIAHKGLRSHPEGSSHLVHNMI